MKGALTRGEVVAWLYKRLADSKKAERAAKRLRDYGEAQLILGHIEAYSFAIIHFKNVSLKKRPAAARRRP